MKWEMIEMIETEVDEKHDPTRNGKTSKNRISLN